KLRFDGQRRQWKRSFLIRRSRAELGNETRAELENEGMVISSFLPWVAFTESDLVGEQIGAAAHFEGDQVVGPPGAEQSGKVRLARDLRAVDADKNVVGPQPRLAGRRVGIDIQELAIV